MYCDDYVHKHTTPPISYGYKVLQFAFRVRVQAIVNCSAVLNVNVAHAARSGLRQFIKRMDIKGLKK